MARACNDSKEQAMLPGRLRRRTASVEAERARDSAGRSRVPWPSACTARPTRRWPAPTTSTDTNTSYLREHSEERPKNALGGLRPAAYAKRIAKIGCRNPGLQIAPLLKAGEGVGFIPK